MTGKELAQFAISKIGTPYFYGCKNQELTERIMATMHEMYPGTVTVNYMAKARKKGMVGKICTDCSGLISWYTQKTLGSSQLYSSATDKLSITDIKVAPVGAVLWKSGHVGVYIGIENGVSMCVEAKGIDYGVVKTKVKDTAWKYALLLPNIEYYDSVKFSETKTKNPYIEPTENIGNGSTGAGVKWVQFELREAGYNLKVDGIFGQKSVNALKKFQQSCKISADGICGAVTRKYLKNN